MQGGILVIISSKHVNPKCHSRPRLLEDKLRRESSLQTTSMFSGDKCRNFCHSHLVRNLAICIISLAPVPASCGLLLNKTFLILLLYHCYCDTPSLNGAYPLLLHL